MTSVGCGCAPEAQGLEISRGCVGTRQVLSSFLSSVATGNGLRCLTGYSGRYSCLPSGGKIAHPKGSRATCRVGGS